MKEDIQASLSETPTCPEAGNLRELKVRTVRSNPPDYLTLEEASDYSTLSVRSLWTAIGSGRLKILRPPGRSGRGGRVIMRRLDLQAFLELRVPSGKAVAK